MYCASVLSLKFITLSHIWYDKGKNVDNMQKVRYQHHNSICESMINRPHDLTGVCCTDDPAEVLVDSP